MHSDLTEELLEELVATHREGGDFLDATALRCMVKPDLLDEWIRSGLSEAGSDLEQELAHQLLKVEADLRAQALKQKNAWYLERRFRRWRSSDKLEEGEAAVLLLGAKGDLSPEQEEHAVRELLRNPTTRFRRLLAEESEHVLRAIQEGNEDAEEYD